MIKLKKECAFYGVFRNFLQLVLRMSEVNEVDHQAMQHMLTEGCVDSQGFGRQIALKRITCWLQRFGIEF